MNDPRPVADWPARLKASDLEDLPPAWKPPTGVVWCGVTVRLWYWLGSGEPPNETNWIFLDDDNRSPYTRLAMNSEPMTITAQAALAHLANPSS